MPESPPIQPTPPASPVAAMASPKKSKAWLWWLIGGAGFVALLPCLLMLAYGIGIEKGVFPDSAAVPESRINARTLEHLRDLGVIAEGERVLYFYSTGLIHVGEDGNLFTDRRVVSYETVDGKLEIYQAKYDQIIHLELVGSGGLLEDSTIIADVQDGTQIYLLVSAEGGGDQKFFDRLDQEWRAHRPENPASAEP